MKRWCTRFNTDVNIWGLGVFLTIERPYFVTLTIHFLCFCFELEYRLATNIESGANGLSWVLDPDLINGNDELPFGELIDQDLEALNETVYRIIVDDVYELIRQKEEHSGLILTDNEKGEVLRQVDRSFSCMEELGYFVDWIINDMRRNGFKPIEPENYEVEL
jgi:hypothetical protein